jgi:tRNA threonylcarbamoyladenosine biosynthesis protein TsaB
MNLLAIDTSSNACSVALQLGDDIREQHVVEPRAHTTILLPMISQLLAAGGVVLNELDAIVLGNGPGSFIGMRIGASVVQGLCFGADIPVVPVSSLAAVAAEAFGEYPHDNVVIAQDARMNEVYLASFLKGAKGLPQLVDNESIVAVGELPIANVPYAAAGAAWAHYPELADINRDSIIAVLPILVPRARYLLATGQMLVESGQSINPDAVTPAYLRTKVAEKPASPQ